MRALAGFAVVLGVAFLADAPVLVALSDAPSWVPQAAAQVTWVGNTAWQAALLLVLVITFSLSRPDQASTARAQTLLQLTIACFLLILLTGIAVQILKFGFGRPRPSVLGALSPYTFAPFTSQPSWNAFPSGHATTMGALAGLAIRLWPRAAWAAVILAMTVGISRVLVGKHYPSDVVAGLALGAVLAGGMLAKWDRAGMIPPPRAPLHFPALGLGPLSGLGDIPRTLWRQIRALI